MLDLSYSDDEGGLHTISVDADRAEIAAALSQLHAETGILIDPYANSRLYPDHQMRLVAIMVEQAPHSQLPGELLAFMRFLRKAAQEDRLILAVGD